MNEFLQGLLIGYSFMLTVVVVISMYQYKKIKKDQRMIIFSLDKNVKFDPQFAARIQSQDENGNRSLKGKK